MTPKVQECCGALDPQAIGKAMYGLRLMGDDREELVQLVAALATKGQESRKTLGAQGVGNAIYERFDSSQCACDSKEAVSGQPLAAPPEVAQNVPLRLLVPERAPRAKAMGRVPFQRALPILFYSHGLSLISLGHESFLVGNGLKEELDFVKIFDGSFQQLRDKCTVLGVHWLSGTESA